MTWSVVTLKDLTQEQDLIYLFTDGACKNNGYPNAKASYAVYCNSTQCDISVVKRLEENPTNQRAELMAILEALQTITDYNLDKVVIVSDSMYAINCVTKWCDAWEKNNWKNSKKQPVKNADIIKQILNYKCTYVNFYHIYSHQCAPEQSDDLLYKLWLGNNTVDGLCNSVLF